MMREVKGVTLAVIVLAVAVAAVGGGSARNGSPASKAEDDFQLVKVADEVYAAIAKPGGLASGNAGFVIGDDGVLIFDTFGTPAALEELIGEIQSLTKLPIRYGVNSHYHLDHTGGNQVLVARGIPIIAHANVLIWQTTKNKRFLPATADLEKRKADAVKQLSDTPEDQKEKRAQLEQTIRRLDALMAITLTNPTKTFKTGTMEIKLGKRKVILATFPGHTGGDVIAFVPDANVVFTGDLGWSKTLPNLIDATVNDWIPTLDTMLKEHPQASFVPGHGNVATAPDIKDFRDYLDDLRARVKQGIANGLTVDQAKQQLTLPEKYKAFAFQNFAVRNVEDMFKELKGTKFTTQ
jgi:glyoxylase-like metal-dependent hydrolase (beta-lactamase superfamily II)